MIQPIYLICGVPGSGKTWVCNQLIDKFNYIPHDDHLIDPFTPLLNASKMSVKPIITESPFAERPMREKLEQNGMKIIPYFIVEHPDIAKKRYEDRDKKPYPKSFYSRASSIINRAQEWKAPYGTSEQILELLMNS